MSRIFVGTDDFSKLVLQSDLFVDKSQLIKQFLESGDEVTLVTRPRRFGKSLNMDMIRRFLEIELDDRGNSLPEDQKINPKLFRGGEVFLESGEKKILSPLRIAMDGNPTILQQLGMSPVISISFKELKGVDDFEGMLAAVSRLFQAVFKDHIYIYESGRLSEVDRLLYEAILLNKASREDIKAALYLLSQLLYNHFGRKVYILIDEYDMPLNSSFVSFGDNAAEFEKVLQLFRGIMGSSLKGNRFLQKALVTGILRISKASLFSDLNNMREYSVFDERYSADYGFTEDEVNTLISHTEKTSENVISLKNEIKKWYNGYQFGSHMIYNPWSVMCTLANQGQLDYYWLDSGGVSLIDKTWIVDHIQEDLQKLSKGQDVIAVIARQISFSEIDQPNGLFSLLVFAGYLNARLMDVSAQLYVLSIPNHEVDHIYRARLQTWIARKLQVSEHQYHSFVMLLADGKFDEFKEEMRDFLKTSTSFHQTGRKSAEIFYNGFMLGLMQILSADYIIESEGESGYGRFDLMLIPRSGRGRQQGMVIEYKVSRDENEDLETIAQKGLVQIAENQYATKLKAAEGVMSIAKISMAFRGKQMALVHEVETVSRKGIEDEIFCR